MTESVESTEEVITEVVEVKTLADMTTEELCDFVAATAMKAKEIVGALGAKTFKTKSEVTKVVTAIRKDLTAIHSGVTKGISATIFGMKESAMEACAANTAASKALSIDEEIEALMAKKAALTAAE